MLDRLHYEFVEILSEVLQLVLNFAFLFHKTCACRFSDFVEIISFMLDILITALFKFVMIKLRNIILIVLIFFT